jgi:hypothetical protein
MATTIDHLRVDHRVTILRDVTDAAGVTMRAGERGILRTLEFDQIRLEALLGIEREDGKKVTLRFPMRVQSGPRLGHMKEFFELGEDVTLPRPFPAFRAPSVRKMIVPPPENKPASTDTSAWARAAHSLDGPDRIEDVEKQMQAAIPYLGVAASIAEMYARRMRAFQRAGNEPRAVAAFKLAVDWMRSYAAGATSGGEGAALSDECDRFHAALTREFGYDPTEQTGPS